MTWFCQDWNPPRWGSVRKELCQGGREFVRNESVMMEFCQALDPPRMGSVRKEFYQGGDMSGRGSVRKRLRQGGILSGMVLLGGGSVREWFCQEGVLL